MKKKVLVIDDELTMRTLLEFFLGSKYEVASVGSAIEALAWLDDHLPDLILLDWMLPDVSGFALRVDQSTHWTLSSLIRIGTPSQACLDRLQWDSRATPNCTTILEAEHSLGIPIGT